MRKTILFALSLLAASATLANAEGLNLRWSNCAADGGVQSRTFACNTNVGTHVFVGSFILDQALSQVNGNELIVDLYFDLGAVPEWWKFRNVGSCRLTELSIAAQDGAGCPDPFLDQASMNIGAYQLGLLGPNTARIRCVNAVQSEHVVNLVGGQEYGLARWMITNTKSVGTGSCGGCSTVASIMFNEARLTTVGGANDRLLIGGTAPDSFFITWQGGVVPTRTTTWSAVKSLYR